MRLKRAAKFDDLIFINLSFTNGRPNPPFEIDKNQPLGEAY